MFGRNSLFQTSFKLSKDKLILSEYTIQSSSPLIEVGNVNRDFGGALVDASDKPWHLHIRESVINSTSPHFICNCTELVANTKALLLWPLRTSSLEVKSLK